MTTAEIRTQIYAEMVSRELRKREKARENLIDFTKYTFTNYQTTEFHKIYASILDLFIQGKIRKLIVTMPPQHGKTELSTRRLPAMLFGLNNKLRIAIASYNTTKAREFSNEVQRIIAEPIYSNVFDDVYIRNAVKTKQLNINKVDIKRTQEYVEIMNKRGNVRGNLRAVGRGGPLTGNPVDFMVMDDLYKDYKEGNSPVIRQGVIDWYSSVVRTRLHNDSQELIVFTRWHEDDLIGYIEKQEEVIELCMKKQLQELRKDCWYKINFPAIMTEKENWFDKREKDIPLWPEKHNLEKLENYRKLDVEKFESLYQGDPQPLQGLLYDRIFKVYKTRPSIRYIYNYTDTADTGKDYLCSIDYAVGVNDKIYVIDVVYTQEPQEETEILVSDMIQRDWINKAVIESNNGGRAFARNIDRICRGQIYIEWFHQSENKESRIFSNKSNVQRNIYFPQGWEERWPLFYKHITRFKKNFIANEHDDAPDALTGCWEHSGLDENNLVLWE